MKKAQLLYYHKAKLHEKFIVELVIYKVNVSKQYKDGIRYSLFCENTHTKEKVLIDNHHPKGHHVHINKDEFFYDFKDTDQLIEDFKKIIFEHLGVQL